MEIRLSDRAGAQRLDVRDCFERGRQTRRAPPLPVQGPRVEHNGVWASFSLRLEAGRVADIRFQAPACTTLIAYCQAAVEHCADRPVSRAAALDGEGLVARLPGVPAMRQDRAVLAAAALRAALATAAGADDSHVEKKQ